MDELKAKILSRIVEVNGPLHSKCWIWLGAKAGKGYGAIWNNHKNELVHRVMWMIHSGSIPKGLSVLHHCDNRICCNPTHLFLGTDQDNVDDMMSKGRKVRGDKCYNAKLTEDDVERIRLLLAKGLTLKAIGDKFGVSTGAVSSIKRGDSWNYRR